MHYIVGRFNGGTIDNCRHNNGIVNASSNTSTDMHVGGLVGYTDPGCLIQYSSTRSIVNGGTGTGLCNTGGLVGTNYATIEYSFATGAVHCVFNTSITGGLVGANFGNISYSFATGNVTGFQSIGGFIGENTTATISNCYAKGNVAGTPGGQNIGGFVGLNSGSTIQYCYSTGHITWTGILNYGGFAGMFGGVSNGCVYDYESAGVINGTGIPKSGNQMITMITFTDPDVNPITPDGWDISINLNTIWNIDPSRVINNGYPYLRLNPPQ